MNYQIVLKDIEPIHVAYMKYVGVVTEANKVVFQQTQHLLEMV